MNSRFKHVLHLAGEHLTSIYDAPIARIHVSNRDLTPAAFGRERTVGNDASRRLARN